MRYRIVPGRSRIECHATGSLHGMKVTTDRVTGEIELADEGDEVTALWVEVDTRSLDAGDFLRNHQMHDYLETGRNPTARLDLTEAAALEGGRLVFGATLSYRGHQVPLRLTAHGERDAGLARAKCVFTARFTEYGMKPPKLLFLKIHDPVEVRVALEAEAVPG